MMTREPKKTKEKALYFIKRGAEAHHVIKMVEEEDGTVRKESEYKITKGGCECKAFSFQRACKHIDMVMQERVEGHPVSLREARECVRSLIHEFRSAFSRVSLPPEPYERDETEKIVCATILLGKPIQESAVLTKGTWEGCLRDNGLKVRLVIE